MKKFKLLFSIASVLVFFVLMFQFLSVHTNLLARTPPVDQDPGINLRLPGWSGASPTAPDSGDPKRLLYEDDGVGPDSGIEPLAPQFSTLVGDEIDEDPDILNLYQINEWNYDANTPGGPIPAQEGANWGVTLMEIGAASGESIRVPQSGYTITATGEQALILYADERDVVLKYTNEDDIVGGYTVYILDFNVSPEILSLYESKGGHNRDGLPPAVPCGMELGTSDGSVLIAARDTGTFIDPRVARDWWHEPAPSECNELEEELLPLKRPLDEGFTVGKYACSETTNEEFHSLRPYPANACDPLIPQSVPPATDARRQERTNVDFQKYITYSCGNSLTPVGNEGFGPYGKAQNDALYGNLTVNNGSTTNYQEYAHTICEQNGLEVTCYRSSSFDLTAQLKDANLGILGNTQNPNLTDEQKVNDYLSYYLTGVPQISDKISSTDPEEIERVVNFSGPVRKLLPWDLQNVDARGGIAYEGERSAKGSSSDTSLNIHNYSAGEPDKPSQRLSGYAEHLPPDRAQYVTEESYKQALKDWRYGNSILPDIALIGDPIAFAKQLFGLQTKYAKLFQNIPLVSVEDTPGEFVLTMFGPGERQDPDIVGQYPGNGKVTAPAELTITKALPASGAAGTIYTPPSTYKPPTPKKFNCADELLIMPFGDSITSGVPSPLKDENGANVFSKGGYRGPLQEALTLAGIKYDFVGNSPQVPVTPPPDDDHEGWGGEGSVTLLGKMRAALPANNPNVVLIHVGTNNLQDNGLLHGKNIGIMVDEINKQNPNAIIFVAKIIPLPRYPAAQKDWQDLNDYIDTEISKKQNVVVVDMSNINPGSDQVHPDANGYIEMANRWAQAISSSCGGGGGNSGNTQPQSACSILYDDNTQCNASGPYSAEIPDSQLVTFTNPYSPSNKIRVLPAIVSKLNSYLAYINSQGLTPIVKSGYRTKAQQLAECNQGDGAPAEYSQHRTGHAVDIYAAGDEANELLTLPDDIIQRGVNLGLLHPFPGDPPHYCIP